MLENCRKRGNKRKEETKKKKEKNRDDLLILTHCCGLGKPEKQLC